MPLQVVAKSGDQPHAESDPDKRKILMELRVQHADSAHLPNELKVLRKRAWKALVPAAAERKAAERALRNPEVELHPLLRAIVLIKHTQAAIAAKAKHAVRKRRARPAIVHDFGACLCGCSDHLWSEPWAVGPNRRLEAIAYGLTPNPQFRVRPANASWRRAPPARPDQMEA